MHMPRIHTSNSICRKMLHVRNKQGGHSAVTPIQVDHVIEFGETIQSKRRWCDRAILKEFEFEDEIVRVKYYEKEKVFRVVDVYGV